MRDKAPAYSHGAGVQQEWWEGDKVNQYISKINADSGRKECAREQATVDGCSRKFSVEK